MARTYTVEFAGVSVAAVQDLLAIYTGASKAVRLHSFQIGQITGTTVANLPLTLKRITGTVASGSGGTTPTPLPLNPGDAAATVTAHANDTTQASGTVAVLVADVFNTVNGYLFTPAPEDQPIAGLSSVLVVSLNSAPSSAMTMSATVTFEELF